MAVAIERLKVLVQRFRGWSWRRFPWGTLGELGLIVAWAMWVGRGYLNLDPRAMPVGIEYGEMIQPQYVWSLLSRCGDCVLWNGFANGGTPAFADVHSVVLHPIIIVTNLIWGVFNGTKIALIASLAIAGFAQWWLARVLRLGIVARLWSAALAVAGGHLAGRMEGGIIPLVVSTASASLMLAPALDLGLYGHRRSTVWLGITGALTILASLGYIQLGVLFGIVPSLAVFIIRPPDRYTETGVFRPWLAMLKEFAIAGLLAVLLSGLYLVPVIHLLPSFVKDVDPKFSSVQPLEYLPLNLVIRDISFYTQATLGKQPFPFLYVNFIGWLPVLLSLVAIRLLPREGFRQLSFFIASMAFILLAASALTFKLMAPLMPVFVYGIRNPTVIAGLVVPILLGLAAWGLDLLLQIPWPQCTITLSDSLSRVRSFKLSLSTVVLAVLLVPLGASLRVAADFGRGWLKTIPISESDFAVVAALRTDSAQWVAPPFGEHYWNPLLNEAGLKHAQVIRPWALKGYALPKPYLAASRSRGAAQPPGLVQTVDGIHIVKDAANEYAQIISGSDRVPCRATAWGGHIDVECKSPNPGTLLVYEHNWPGWKAWRDDVPVSLVRDQWLKVEAPAGIHHYRFRYRPWDVPVGLAVTCIGIGLAIWLWIKYPDRKTQVTDEATKPKSDPGTGT